MKIHILLADDHTILRAGLKMMLNAQPDMEVVGEAQGGRLAIQEAQRLRHRGHPADQKNPARCQDTDIDHA